MNRIAYTGPIDTVDFRTHLYSGRIIWEDDQWWLAQYYVAYTQQGICTASTFSCREKADIHFDERYASIKPCWKGGCIETDQSSMRQPRRIHFRSIRKNGKPGTLTGILYMQDMREVTVSINAGPINTDSKKEQL